MENPVEMAESYSLAGVFQQIVQDSKHSLPLFDELINKTSKFHSQIKVTITALGAFLDTFQKIADNASNTKGSSRDIGICLTRIVIRHKTLEAHMKTLANTLIDGFMFPIQSKTDEWKKSIIRLDKEHSNEFKKVRLSIKRKTDFVLKLRKKYRKEPSQQLNIQIEQATQDLNVKYQVLEEQERQAVRRINTQERSHYCTVAACLKPVIAEEFTMLSEIQQLDQVMDRLGKIMADPTNIPDNYFTEMSGESYNFSTPPESPGGSALGSRTGSLRSISSQASSTPSSVSSLADDASSKSKGCNKRVCILPHHRQDSGFTSQNFIMQRNSSPQSHSNKDMLDSGQISPRGRPRIISTSYNGAHSRPPISGNTFSQQKTNQSDRSRKDYMSKCHSQAVYSTVRRAHSPFRKSLDNTAVVNKPVTRRPPLPRRCNSVDRPAIPQRSSSLERPHTANNNNQQSQDTVKYGASLAGRDPSLTHAQPHYATPRNNVTVNSLPQIAQARETNGRDLFPSQPVYMNSLNVNGTVSDTSPGFEEDLKTPTVEEMSFPECKMEDTSSSSSGSSSGYGSQIAVIRIEQQQQDYSNEVSLSPTGTNTIIRRKCPSSLNKPPILVKQAQNPVDLDEVTPHGSIEKFPPPPVHVLTSQGQQIYCKSSSDYKTTPGNEPTKSLLPSENSLDKDDRDISDMLSDLNNKLTNSVVHSSPNSTNRVVRSSPNSTNRAVGFSPNSTVSVVCSSPNSTNRVMCSSLNSTNRFVCSSPNSTNIDVFSSPNSTNRVVRSNPNSPRRAINSSPNCTVRVVGFSPNSVLGSSPNSIIKRSNSIGVSSVRPVDRPDLKYSTINQEDKANFIRALNEKLSPQTPLTKPGTNNPHVLRLPVNSEANKTAIDPNLYKFGSKNLSLSKGSTELKKTFGHSQQNPQVPKSLDLVSPEGEQYGFGTKFKENRVNYFGNSWGMLSTCTNQRDKQVCCHLPH